METRELLTRTVDQANQVMAGVQADQLAAATPCTDWDVRGLIGHLLGGALMFAAAGREGSVPADLLAEIGGPELVGDDFAERFRAASTDFLQVFSDPKAFEGMLALPFGTMPAPVVFNLAVTDLAVHTADLAKATGQTFADAELAEAMLGMLGAIEAGMGEMFRSPNVYGPQQPCDADAPAPERLLAFAGRAV